MEGLIMTAQILLSLSILVGLHELGHMLTAKLFGMRVEQFSIGFPPRIFGKQYGETLYSIGALPLGGFVKISGMVDESLDTKKLGEEPKEYEFRAKPAWQRLIVMLGGIIVNVITGVIIFVSMVYAYGESYIPKDQVMQHGIVAYDLGQEIGLQTGDKIVALNGKEYDKFSDLTSPEVLFGDSSFYTIERNGEKKKVTIPGNFIDKLSEEGNDRAFMNVRTPFAVKQVMKDSPAMAAGLQDGDEIVSVSGTSLQYFDQLQDLLAKNSGKQVQLGVIRNGSRKTIQANVTEEGTLGFAADLKLDVAYQEYSLGQSIPEGIRQSFSTIAIQVMGFAKIFSGELDARKSISSPIGIAKIFGGTWDWSRFWRLTGLLSMVLAFMNLLPIPALDGGHVMFILYEMVSGRKPSDSFLENAQKVGMVLLLSLMTFAIFNDIFKALF